MIPILYEKDETVFASNGLGRLRDCISCMVTEERNGVYELDFEYPVTGQHFDEIQIGRIVAVEHDDSGNVQPFDIVGYEKPIEGVVTFHCVHVSYRQSYMTVTGTNISSLANAFTRLKNNATPSNPFTYWTDKSSTGYVGAFDGVPKSVRSMLGGVEGSILDAYGGEYEWDKFQVKLWSQRGEYRDFTIRYGVNMMEYNDETDSSECYSSIIPYWTDGTTTVVGDKQTASGLPPSGRDACVPMDVSEKFENQPTKAQVNSMGLSVLNSGQPYLPTQNITVSFVRLQDTPEYAQFANLLRCGLCDTIKVIFPDYQSSGTFKIVRTVWNVLSERYEEMELGDLSISLSEALGINDIQKDSKSTIEQIMERLGEDFITEQGTSGGWTYRKWDSGDLEQWYSGNPGAYTVGTARGSLYSGNDLTYTFPVAFTNTPMVVSGVTLTSDYYVVWSQEKSLSQTSINIRIVSSGSISQNSGYNINIYAKGRWR